MITIFFKFGKNTSEIQPSLPQRQKALVRDFAETGRIRIQIHQMQMFDSLMVFFYRAHRIQITQGNVSGVQGHFYFSGVGVLIEIVYLFFCKQAGRTVGMDTGRDTVFGGNFRHFSEQIQIKINCCVSVGR